MKKQVNPAVIVVALVIVLAVIGAVAYKVFGPEHLPDVHDAATVKKYFPNGYPYTKNMVTPPAAGTGASK